MNQLSASEEMTLTTSRARLLPATMPSVKAAISSSAGEMPARMACPLSVSTTRLLWRANNFRLRKTSSLRTCWLTAAGVTFNSAAAATKLPVRAADSNDFKALSGGRRSVVSGFAVVFLLQANIFRRCGLAPACDDGLQEETVHAPHSRS
jgi:hypothetical protein